MVDGDVLDLSDELRAAWLRTAVLTNGTDTIPAELAAHAISDRFDAVFNSADIGFAKPDARAFQHVLDAPRGLGNGGVLHRRLRGEAGRSGDLSMHTHLFAGVEDLRAQLIAAGMGIGRPAREVFEEAK